MKLSKLRPSSRLEMINGSVSPHLFKAPSILVESVDLDTNFHSHYAFAGFHINVLADFIEGSEGSTV